LPKRGGDGLRQHDQEGDCKNGEMKSAITATPATAHPLLAEGKSEPPGYEAETILGRS
jgi:hypothetical protein